MNSYWVAHAVSENHCETTESLKICYLLNNSQDKVDCTKILEVDELIRRINTQWAALSHRVIECAVVEWHQGLRACVRA